MLERQLVNCLKLNYCLFIVQLKTVSRQFLYNLWEVLEVVLIATITVFLIRAFIVQPFLISGSSMIDTFHDGDYVLVDELTYRFKEPERGDVVVFRYPLNPRLFYIKRVIGIEGDLVEVNRGKVIINGKELQEPYLKEDMSTSGNVLLNIDKGYFFAMGDNRIGSYDSRNFGPVPKDNIIGVVRVRLLPFASAKIFERPVYNL